MTLSRKSIEEIIKRDLGTSYRLVERQPGEDSQEEASSPPDAGTPELRPRYRARVHVAAATLHPIKPTHEEAWRTAKEPAAEEFPAGCADSPGEGNTGRPWSEDLDPESVRDIELFLVENAQLPVDSPAARRTVVVSRREGRVVGEQG